ncbi:MAG TPA: sensor histidine kinase [Candidatus Acidoferrum sp.]|nr:sensor histidine kinase [Candidatus Acidoferrum sp.]
MTLGWSKRAGLRAGFGAVIAVLILSAFEAYRIQLNVSRQHLEIYRHFVEQDEALATLRKNVWLAGNFVREFFISSTPAQGRVLAQQLDGLAQENEAALAALERAPRHQNAVPHLRESLREFWAVVKPLPRTMPHANSKEEIAFLEREVVPRRGELYNALRTLTLAAEQKLMDSQGEFAEARRSATRGLLAMLALGVLLSFLVAQRSLRHSENLESRAARHFAEVEQARRELQQLSARLLEIEEEGRRRLSRELHDEIGQTLALLQIEISHAAAIAGDLPGDHKVRLERARSLTERTVQTVRNMSVLLRPALLDDLGLVPALQFQLEDFLRRSRIACEFHEHSVAANLPDSVKTCVYRVVQEALHNAEKHSSATSVRVSVRQYPDRLVAEIADNGCGFALDQQGRPSSRSGLGLLGMRERATIAGGSLAIESSPGRGTRVVVQIPIAAVAIVQQTRAKEVPA